MRNGEKNGRAKLTDRRVQILKTYYHINRRPHGAPQHHSWVTVAEIAKCIRMAKSATRSMLNGESWPHVKMLRF